MTAQTLPLDARAASVAASAKSNALSEDRS